MMSKMVENKKIPTVKQVRDIINRVGVDIDPRNNRRVRKNLDLHQLQSALKYQFLTACQASQVSGKYGPIKRIDVENAIELKIGNKKAVIFLIKKTKVRKRTQKVYAPCIPLDSKYEPWTKEVLDYMQDNDNPFQFNTNPASSKRQLEAATKEIFKDYIWMYKEYRGVRKKEDGDIEYVNIPAREKKFSNGGIQKIRVVDLISNYGFDYNDVITFGVWENNIEGAKIPRSIVHLLEFEIDNITEESINLLTGIATNYFKKLCKQKVDPTKLVIM